MTHKPRLILRDDEPRTTSLAVAEYFGKNHRDVMRAIRNLETACPDPAWYERNFALIQTATDLGLGRTRKDPAYEMTKDGFSMLAFGFTGAAAFAWKIRYIEAFNAMQRVLNEHREKELRADADRAIADANKAIVQAQTAEADADAYQNDVVAMARQVLAEMEAQARANATADAAKLTAMDIAARLQIPKWSKAGGYLSEAFMLMFFGLERRYADAALLWTLYDEFEVHFETRKLSAHRIVEASGKALCRNTVYLSRQRLIARGLLFNLDAADWRINCEPFDKMMRETQLVADMQRVPTFHEKWHGPNKKLAQWLNTLPAPKSVQ